MSFTQRPLPTSVCRAQLTAQDLSGERRCSRRDLGDGGQPPSSTPCAPHQNGLATLWKLRSPWRDCTKAFRFDPLVFVERLVAIAPHPREHQLIDHGVFAPASSLRHFIVLRPSAVDPEHERRWLNQSDHDWQWFALSVHGEWSPIGPVQCLGHRHDVGRILPRRSAAELLWNFIHRHWVRCPFCLAFVWFTDNASGTVLLLPTMVP